MTTFEHLLQKIQAWPQAAHNINRWQQQGDEIVFTNGCFDLLHRGHYAYLAQAKDLGHHLVVGLNSDASVRRLKGENRPIHTEQDRALALAALSFVDLVVIFDQDTPLELINLLRPDVLVKGGDYKIETIVGAAETLALGGQVLALPFVEGFSSTAIINKLS